MSILARIMQLDPRIGPGPLRTELSADMDLSAVREQAAQSAAVVAQREQEARLAALAEEEAESVAVVEEPDPVIPPTDPDPEPTGRTVQSTQTIIKNGRIVFQTIYSDGTIEEQDLGPSDPGVSDPPPPAPVLGDLQEQFNAREFAQANYSYLGEELLETFIGEYNSNGGDVDEALRTIFSIKIGREAMLIRKKDMVDYLELNVQPELVEKMKEILTSCESVRYGMVANNDDLNRIEANLKLINETLK